MYDFLKILLEVLKCTESIKMFEDEFLTSCSVINNEAKIHWHPFHSELADDNAFFSLPLSLSYRLKIVFDRVSP
jgi:hypothetical protein